MRHYNNISDIDFKSRNNNFYTYVVTLSINKSIKSLGQLKQGFSRTVSWNKYRSDITTQPNGNNLDYIIDAILMFCYSKIVIVLHGIRRSQRF